MTTRSERVNEVIDEAIADMQALWGKVDPYDFDNVIRWLKACKENLAITFGRVDEFKKNAGT